MPITQPFYLNADNFYSATAVFLDAALTMCAPDGFYAGGGIVRELVNCKLLPLQQCPNCCSQGCTSWNVVGNQGPFTLKYGRCSLTPSVAVEDYPDGTDIDICVAYGDIPNILVGNAVLSINQNCGCCAGPCEQWSITNVSEKVTVSYKSCNGSTLEKVVSEGFTGNFCIESGTLPVIISGVAIVEFDFCDCID